MTTEVLDNTEKVVEFVPLLNFEDKYEILNKYPFTIRRKNNHYKISENFDNYGYVKVHINNISMKKHRLIALQFIPNDDPEHKTEVDHINHDRSDNHLSNLRWVNHSNNCINKTGNKSVKYEFYDEIPDESIIIDNYVNHSLENYYYYDNIFYFYNGIQYRKLHINEDKYGNKFVKMKDKNNKYFNLSYSKFKKLYDLT